MPAKLQLENRKFVRLVAVRPMGTAPGGSILWECLCDCGVTCSVSATQLATGKTRSCGCLQREAAGRIASGRSTHGMAKTPEHRAWMSMRKRCLLQTGHNYHLYGGRGITVCDRWLESFENFYADMGPRPSAQHSLDRIDNNGNYEPGNCRWATPKEQARNRRSNVYLTYNGKTQSPAEWSQELGLSLVVLSKRISYGWSAERALTQKVRKRNG